MARPRCSVARVSAEGPWRARKRPGPSARKPRRLGVSIPLVELWIPLTIAAAFCQNLRSALQKRLQSDLSTTGATFARFIYAFPLAIAYVWALHAFAGHAVPATHPRFVFYAVTGGVAQIFGTALLLYAFTFRNFLVGTTYSKTEAVQAAVFGLVVLGESVTPLAGLGVLVSLVGVVAISVAHGEGGFVGVVRGLASRAALCGIASGSCFALAAVAYRGASISLEADSFLIAAAFTLAVVTTLQTGLMAGYMLVREPDQLARVARAWPVAGLVGLSGMLASAGWFSAMTLQNAAYVRALGKIELVFTFLASALFFRERIDRVEVFGVVLVVGGLILLVLD